MTINLELSEALQQTVERTHLAAEHVLRPISRKYDLAEHTYPVELDELAKVADEAQRQAAEKKAAEKQNGASVSGAASTDAGATMQALLSSLEMSWGDLGLLLSLPGRGLGNAAIAAVATPQQREKFAGVWAAMAITEPGFGSDSAAVSTTATRDGDDYVINGEKIFVTAGSRADHIVVWATVDKSAGRAAIKSFVVPRESPGVTVARVEDKLGIKSSDTAVVRFEDCRVPAENLLGSPEVNTEKSFGGVMQTFDNTRPLVAAMAVGISRAALEELRRLLEEAGLEIDYDRPVAAQHAAVAEYIRLEADYEATYLLALRAAWMADHGRPNSAEASMSKAKGGRTVTDLTTKTVELVGTLGYSEELMLEKWARDAKILDIFEGTQQIQNLIIARRLLDKSSAELR
ncbi:acyl-CoA dehydrogenase family protein [Williamsia sterculiae]|uniref:Acyl-CoA dehydrogenase n=1 Tax=Williamsia sterculiae TaxID=1344003 RepID=A0A1N7FHE6_9NOCA|nr:acyl-CoA dehydrogenase family protein [Williamsia sterculiae]SIR99704.1 acyl-CoA dehydrogenase [Williamsia sterculiae]